MTGRKRVWVWVTAVVGGLGLVGLGVFFVANGLDKADKWASVIGVFAALIGLGVAVLGLVQVRATSGGQHVDGVDAGDDIDMIGDVGGSVRFGSPESAPSTNAAPPPPPSGAQSVKDVRTGGRIRMIRGVGGDVDITS